MWQMAFDNYVVFSRSALSFAGYLLIQSSVLTLIGLIAGRLLRGAGAALQSAIYRLTLAAVILCPLLSLLFQAAGMHGIALNLPLPSASQELSKSELTQQSYPEPSYKQSANTHLIPPDAVPTGAIVEEVIQAPVATPTSSKKLSSDNIPPSSRSKLVKWPNVKACTLTAIWLLISGALSIRLLWAWRLTSSLRRSGCAADARILADCLALAKQMNVRCPLVLHSPFTASPLLMGIWRPAILLPEEQTPEICGQEILVHELAHLVRHDVFWNLLGRISTALLFFQPLLWHLVRKIIVSSEEVCDDYVVHFGLDRSGYAQRLVEIAENHQPLPVMSAGVISLRSFVGRRVVRILDSSRRISTRLRKRTVFAVVLVSLATTCLAGLITLGANRAAADTEKAAAPRRENNRDSGKHLLGATADDAAKKVSASPAKQDPTADVMNAHYIKIDEVREEVSPETKARSIFFRVYAKKGERFYITTTETSKRRDFGGGNLLFESQQNDPVSVKLTFRTPNLDKGAGDVLLGKAELIAVDVVAQGCYPPGVTQVFSTLLGNLPPEERKIAVVKSDAEWGAIGSRGRRLLLVYPKSKSPEKFEEIEPRAEIVIAKELKDDRRPAQIDPARRLIGIWLRQQAEIGTAQIEYLHVNLGASSVAALTPEQVEKVLVDAKLAERPENLDAIFPKILVKPSIMNSPKGVRKFINVGLKTREDFTVEGRLKDVRYFDGEIDLNYDAANKQVDITSAENSRVGRTTVRDFRISPDAGRIESNQIRTNSEGKAVVTTEGNGASTETIADAATGFVHRRTTRSKDGKISTDEFQYLPTKFAPNIVYPKIKISLSYNSGELSSLEIFRIDSAKFNEGFPADAFVISLPAPLNIIDYRKDGFHAHTHSIESAVPNLIDYIHENLKVPQSDPPAASSEPRQTSTPKPEAAKQPEKSTENGTAGEKPKTDGRVVDSQGVGIANATLAQRVQEGIVPSWKVNTDGEGRYTLPPLEPGVANEMMTITAPGFLAKELIRIRNRPAAENIHLQKAASIAGRVLGSDGKPLARAPLSLGLHNNFLGSFYCYLHAISDADGNFSIDNIPPGVAILYYPGTTPTKYELDLGRDKNLLPPGEAWPSPPIKDVYGSLMVELKDGEKATGLAMDLSQSTCRVAGRVLGPDEKPLSNATVSARRYGRNLSFPNLIDAYDAGDIAIKSDAEGRYKLEHLPPGKWALSVWSPHYQRPGKIDYLDFASSGQEIAHDLQVFERDEAENVFPGRIAIEKAETLQDLPKQKRFLFETPTMAQYPGKPQQYSFAELTVNSVPLARINVDQLNLPADASLEQIAKAAHVGELYYIAPDKLVTVNGTVLVPCIIPEKNSPQETLLSRLSRLTRAQLAQQVKAALREKPAEDGRRVTFKKGDWFIAVRNDGRAFLINIEDDQSLSVDFLRLGTFYIGALELSAPTTDRRLEQPGEKPAESPTDPSAKQATASTPKINPVAAKTAQGRVVDENGKPIPGADVWMMPAWDPVQKRPAAHVLSDSDGRFTLAVPAVSNHDMQIACPYPIGAMWAYAEGHQLAAGYAGDQIFGRDKSDVVIRLGPAADTPFVVLGPDGKPLEGALVEPGYVKNGEPPEEARSRVAVRTNADGRAVLTAAPRDAVHSIRIVTEDFGIQTQTLSGFGSAPADQPFRLRQAGKISGTLTAEKPEMLRRVRITLSTGSPRAYPGGNPPSLTAGYADVESDEKGRFSIPAIAAGRLGIDACVEANSPVLPRIPDDTNHTIEVHPNETINLQITLEPTVAVKGSLRAKDTGKPIPGKFVQLLNASDGREAALVITDPQGNFNTAVLPGRIQVEFGNQQSDYVQFGDRPIVEVSEKVKEFAIPPVELVPTKRIVGRLIDRTDQPVANTTVWIKAGDRGYGYGQTNAQGEFTLNAVPVPIDSAKAKYQTSPPDSTKFLGNTIIQTPPSDGEIVRTDPLVLRVPFK